MLSLSVCGLRIYPLSRCCPGPRGHEVTAPEFDPGCAKNTFFSTKELCPQRLTRS